MRRITSWADAETTFPECSAAFDRDGMQDLFGDTWELFELQRWNNDGGPPTTLWIFVNGEHRAKYLEVGTWQTNEQKAAEAECARREVERRRHQVQIELVEQETLLIGSPPEAAMSPLTLRAQRLRAWRWTCSCGVPAKMFPTRDAAATFSTFHLVGEGTRG